MLLGLLWRIIALLQQLSLKLPGMDVSLLICVVDLSNNKFAALLFFDMLIRLDKIPRFLQFWRSESLAIKYNLEHLSNDCLWPDLMKRMVDNRTNDAWLPKGMLFTTFPLTSIEEYSSSYRGSTSAYYPLQ